MTTQEIRRQLKTEPFVPFRVLTADGRQYDVRHPEHLAYSGKGRLIAIWMDDDSFVTLDLLLVTAVQKSIPASDEPARAAG